MLETKRFLFHRAQNNLYIIHQSAAYYTVSQAAEPSHFPLLDLASICIDLSYITIKHPRKRKSYDDACKNGLASLFLFSKHASRQNR